MMRPLNQTRAGHIIVDQSLTLEDANAIVLGQIKIALHPNAEDRCTASHAQLQQVIADNRHVYGLTTGFGPLANRLVAAQDGTALQQNLVHHLATGVGPEFTWDAARALVLARLMSILQGVSGASPTAITALMTLLNSALSPCVPSKGTVGASGDLTPLAHMVLCFQGRGAFIDAEGRRFDGQEGLDALGLAPLDLNARDGLALVNGTSAMTGVAVRNADLAGRAVAWSETLSAAMAEALSGRAEAWHPAFADVRAHPGQRAATVELNAAIKGSGRIVNTPLAARQLGDADAMIEPQAGQDAYTLRCAPQVIGAVRDTLDWHNRVVLTELSSATDNPIFPPDAEALVLHGGNFMGQHVGLASDALANALCVLAGLGERQVARLTDETLNRGLPAFLHEGTPGLNSGLMGAQVTATALLAEMRTTGAASSQSISTNGANQDVVSMGTVAARQVQDLLRALFQIQAILALAAAQAIDILEDTSDPAFSPQAKALRRFVRAHSARLRTDRPLGREIEALADAMSASGPPVNRLHQ